MMNTQKMVRPAHHKGFTLIELLIVIGILAILATAVILILNPAELFKQARDSQRISDLATMKSALAFYLSTVTGADLDGTAGSLAKCYAYQPIGATPLPDACGTRHTAVDDVYGSTLAIDGTGWLPVDFRDVPGGAPLSALPRDPRSADGFFYSYVANADAGTFEINADMESCRYAGAGTVGCAETPNDVESTDGGNRSDLYEVGNASGLSL